MTENQIVLQYLRNIEQTVVRMDSNLQSHIEKDERDFSAHDIRLRAVESSQSSDSGAKKMFGAMVVAGAGLISFVVNYFHKG